MSGQGNNAKRTMPPYLPPGMSNGAGVEANIPDAPPKPKVLRVTDDMQKWPLDSRGAVGRLRIICRGIGLPDTFTPVQVKAYLARNPEIIRHMALNTVPDPRAYVDEGNFTRELSADPAVRTRFVYHVMNQIIWDDEVIDSILRIVSSKNARDVDVVQNIYRKEIVSQPSPRAERHYRDTIPTYAELRDQEKLANMARIAVEEGSSLIQVMHADEEEEEKKK